MKLFFLFLITPVISLMILKLLKKLYKIKKLSYLNKKKLGSWMKLTKKERYDLTNNDSFNYLNKRKKLLTEIRKEYNNILKKSN